MASKEFLKITAAAALSVLLHVLIFAGIPYNFSQDINFKKKKTEIKLRTFRPFSPEKKIRKVNTDPVAGLKSRNNTVTKGNVQSEVPTPPIPRYDKNSEEIFPSALTDFVAMLKSKEIQDGMESVRKQKKRTWEGKEIVLEKSEHKNVQKRYEETYLDPRVKLVVVSYPPSSIEQYHPAIFYPDMRVKTRELQAGWCNIVVSIFTDEKGNVTRQNVIRPVGKALSTREKVFLDHTLNELNSWSFDAVSSEIIIDVRYFVE